MSRGLSASVVRTRLVAVGLAIALVGGGLVAAVVLGAGSGTTTVTTSISAGISPGGTDNWTVNLTPTSSGALTLAWTSSAPANVSLWQAAPCGSGSGTCPSGPALAVWPASQGGRWSATGSIAGLYILSATNAATGRITFAAAETESYPSADRMFSDAVAWLIIVGAGLLLTLGGIAVFLGLFLPSGVYSGRPEEPRENLAMDLWDDSEAQESDRPR